MPIYEYQCEACGHQLDALQKMTDESLKDCPSCGKSTLQKLVSATSFQLKGTGWYETDFKKTKAPVKNDKPAEGATSTGSETKTTTTTTTDKKSDATGTNNN